LGQSNTLRFTAKTYLFGPVTTATKDIIRSAKISYLAGTDTTNTERDITYTVTPRAIKNYTGTVLTNLSKDAVIADNVLEVDDGTTITAKTYIDIDNEELFVTAVNGNKITVNRGQDGTQIEDHVKGAPIKSITDSDDDLIPMGDDFGFDGTIS
jgi:hypothetical protein